MNLLVYLSAPLNVVSHFVGWLAFRRLPGPIARLSVQLFAWWYGISVQEASEPLSSYRSIGEFFIRDIKLEFRPLPTLSPETILSPVDGVLRNHGHVRAGRLEQIKGREYSLLEFLGERDFAQRFETGYAFNFYLSPPDYHHVHVPISGKIIRRAHIPGTLLPVNDWSVRIFSNVFTQNERVITYIDTPHGLVAVVMVGACNVGSMKVVYEELSTNRFNAPRDVAVHALELPVSVTAGEKLGTFYLGSTVVVLLEFSQGKMVNLYAPLSNSTPVQVRSMLAVIAH